jgi:hypothetical protein
LRDAQGPVLLRQSADLAVHTLYRHENGCAKIPWADALVRPEREFARGTIVCSLSANRMTTWVHARE